MWCLCPSVLKPQFTSSPSLVDVLSEKPNQKAVTNQNEQKNNIQTYHLTYYPTYPKISQAWLSVQWLQPCIKNPWLPEPAEGMDFLPWGMEPAQLRKKKLTDGLSDPTLADPNLGHLETLTTQRLSADWRPSSFPSCWSKLTLSRLSGSRPGKQKQRFGFRSDSYQNY